MNDATRKTYVCLACCLVFATVALKWASAATHLATSLTSHSSFEGTMAINCRHEAESLLVLNSTGRSTPRRENFSPARPGCAYARAVSMPWRPDRRMQVCSLRYWATRAVLRDLQIAWRLLQTICGPLSTGLKSPGSTSIDGVSPAAPAAWPQFAKAAQVAGSEICLLYNSNQAKKQRRGPCGSSM